MPKYALLERERRFLVVNPTAELIAGAHVAIDDRYLVGTRLRLRTMRQIGGGGGDTIYKLCKKYGGGPVGEPIVNIYLTPGEHACFAGMPGHGITKRRYHREWQGVRHAIDVFDGHLSGLVVSEVEAADTPALAAIALPPWATVEVTDDPFFQGGNLAVISAEALTARLQAIAQS